jgi:hypothetical protein
MVSPNKRLEYTTASRRADRRRNRQHDQCLQQAVVREGCMPGPNECLSACYLDCAQLDPARDRADQFPDMQRS